MRCKEQNNTIFIVAIVLIVIAVIGASAGGSNNPQAVSSPKTDESSSQAESQAPEVTSFKMGDKADLDGVAVSLVNVSENNGSAYMKPESGKVFIVCEFEIENNSNKDIAVSSIVSFDAYVDDYSTSMNLSATLSTEKSQLDGTVAAGKKMNGVVGYEADLSWKELEVRFTPDFWKGGQVIFTYSK